LVFFIFIQIKFFTVYDGYGFERRTSCKFYTKFIFDKKNLAGARFKEGVNNKINLYHLWYIATTLLPYDDYHETTAPTSIEQIF